MAEEKYKDPNVYGEQPSKEGERVVPERPTTERAASPVYTEPVRTYPTAREMPYGYEGMRWGPIFGGIFIALAAQAILMTLGVAIGMSTAAGVGTTGVTVGAGIWAVISGLVAFFLGGYVASRTTMVSTTNAGVIIGLVTYSFALALGFLVSGLTAAGFLVSLASFLGPAAVSVMPTPGPTSAVIVTLSAATAWWFFIWMVLGAVAAAVGGMLGARRKVVTTP